MAEYIEREKARELIKNFGKGVIEDGRKALDPVDDIIVLARGVDLIPTADVVEVVRCENCSFWDDGRCEGIRNGLVMEYTEPRDFCSYGKRNFCKEKAL